MTNTSRPALAAFGLVVALAVAGCSDGRATNTAATQSKTTANADCPDELYLPRGIDPRVCGPVKDADLASLKPTSGPYGDGSPMMAFRSPSGSLACDPMGCSVSRWTFAGEYRHSGATLNDDPGVSRDESMVLALPDPQGGQFPPWSPSDVRASWVALDDPTHFAVPTLGYGRVVRMDAHHYCVMQKIGVSCWNPTAEYGIFLSRDRWINWTKNGVIGAS
jgi:hypothetical protein